MQPKDKRQKTKDKKSTKKQIIHKVVITCNKHNKYISVVRVLAWSGLLTVLKEHEVLNGPVVVLETLKL